jgi:two-component system, NarL family, sensor kinase
MKRILTRESAVLEGQLKHQMHQLKERLKELQCLYSIAELGETQMSLQDMLQQIVQFIPSAWQFPEITRARIRVSDKVFTTADFRESPWHQESALTVMEGRTGSVEVFYLEVRPEADEGPFLKEERQLLEAICRLVGQMIERKQTEKDLRSLAAELSLAEQRERLRIATHLHDEVAQPLAMLKIKLGTLRQSLSSDQAAAAELDWMRDQMEQTIKTIRGLSFELAPPILYDFGFEAALEELLEKVEDRYGMQVRYHKAGDSVKLAKGTQVLLYTMAREIIMNVVKHSHCKHLNATLENQEQQLTLTLQDDGIGFDSSSLEKKIKKDGGFGLFSIRERIRHFGGKFILESTPGKGTRVVLSVPCEMST